MKITENKQDLMLCPVCGEKHYVHAFKYETTAVIDGEETPCLQWAHFCKMDPGPRDEFVTDADRKLNEKIIKEIIRKKKQAEAPAPEAEEETEAAEEAPEEKPDEGKN